MKTVVNHYQTPYVTVTKPIGAICNLNCAYCFYLRKQKLYPEKKSPDFRMSETVLEEYIRQYMSKSDYQISFVWQGGEPTLLGLDFFRKIIHMQNQFNTEGKIVNNSLQTNAVNLNDQWARFLKKHHFLVGVSLDGPEHLHNECRVYNSGKGSFKEVMKGTAYLRKHNVDYNILCSVNRFNADHPMEIYEFLKKQSGTNYWQFIPIVEPLGPSNSKVADYSVLPEQYGNFLVKIFNHWMRHDIGKISVQIFDVVFNHFMGLPSGLCLFDETCGKALAVEHNGDFYSCDHYVDREHFLGNIMDHSMQAMVNAEQQHLFGQDKKTTLPAYCLQCPVKVFCNGGCQKNRFISTLGGEAGLNYLCRGYRQFFKYVIPYMQYLSQQYRLGTPFAQIMQYFNEVSPDIHITERIKL